MHTGLTLDIRVLMTVIFGHPRATSVMNYYTLYCACGPTIITTVGSLEFTMIRRFYNGPFKL